jgi:hypothetical protein
VAALRSRSSSGHGARKTSLTDDIARVGLNYRFGWGGPVVAK